MTIIIIIVMSVVINVPNYFLYQVINIQDQKYINNQTGFWIQDSKYVLEYNSYKPTTFWVYGVIMKVAPCILLSLLSTLIILMMKQANKRRARLLHQTTRFADSHDHANCEHNRTTWMLIAVVLFFVITEFPQGILVMISGLDERFFQDVYSNLGDIMDLLVLLNSAVNFILYCIMSQQFRDTFRNLFVGNCCYKIHKINEHQNGNSTHYTTVKSEVTSV
ncbi:hypothetical protein CHS0354_005353 [Potamilus streckersoni]|uniref:G-protein coupled receptors family 1 profile domain-containing protein n=1 Tax=Potamilus streckersoni TaxID=2493646 RepID=A0AAE0SK46_9BIVA|nr:hypothetical protein CHS0354_005353 [Potamilus streckersoni]